jgi:cytoskeletal protein RodZ
MNPAVIITLVVVLIIIIIAVVAWLLYKANFRPTEITVKTGVMEAKMERKPGDSSPTPDAPTLPPARTEATQEATGGSRMKDNTIEAPADSGARIAQIAKDDSSMTNNRIELK